MTKLDEKTSTLPTLTATILFTFTTKRKTLWMAGQKIGPNGLTESF